MNALDGLTFAIVSVIPSVASETLALSIDANTKGAVLSVLNTTDKLQQWLYDSKKKLLTNVGTNLQLNAPALTNLSPLIGSTAGTQFDVEATTIRVTSNSNVLVSIENPGANPKAGNRVWTYQQVPNANQWWSYLIIQGCSGAPCPTPLTPITPACPECPNILSSYWWLWALIALIIIILIIIIIVVAVRKGKE